MRHAADRPGLTAGKVPGPGSIELLVDLLLVHRLAQLLVLLDGHHHRHHLTALTNHIVGVTSGQFAHEGHGNEVDRQHDVTTRRRSTIKAEADPPSQMAIWCSGIAGHASCPGPAVTQAPGGRAWNSCSCSP